jgi:hypothetical protein
MANDIDLFVDQLLEDAVQRSLHEEDFDPAWHRNECPPGKAPVNMSACTALTRALAGPVRSRPPQVTLNNLRGRCAEQRLVARLCSRGFDVRNQVRVGPRPGGSVLDVTRFPGSRRQLPRGIENKYIHTPDYRGCANTLPCPGLCVGAMVQRVPADVRQARRHMAHSVAGAGQVHRTGLAPRVRLLYQLGGPLSRLEFRCAAQAFYAAVQAANAQPPGGPVVRATVVQASRF